MSGTYYDDDLPTSTWQAAGTRESALDERCFRYAQDHQYPARQMHDSSSQYQPAYLQGAADQQRFLQDVWQMGYNAPTQPLYVDMPPYQLLQPTAAEALGLDISQSSTTSDNRRVSEVMPQADPAPLYQQRLQYAPTTDLATLASSNSRTDPEFPEAAGAEPTDQQQREIDSYDYIYSYLRKTNKNTPKAD